MLRRILITSAVAGLAAAAPAGASAATTLGETFAPMADLSCGGPNKEVVQVRRASGISYAAPSPGVLTSWSFESSTLAPTTLTLRVYRPTGTPQEYTPIAEGGDPQAFAASSGLHTTNVTIPVQAGDLIGIRTTDGPCGSDGSTGDVYDLHLLPPSPIPLGTPAVFSEGFEQIFDISAKLEPDCDNDGLGDESQDSNVTAACPVPSSPGTGGQNGQQGATKKKCKKHKKKHKRSAESAKKKKCKKKKK